MKSVENVFDLIHAHHKLDQNSFYGRQDWLSPALPPDTLSVSETRRYFDCLKKSNELLFNCLLKLGNIYKCVRCEGGRRIMAKMMIKWRIFNMYNKHSLWLVYARREKIISWPILHCVVISIYNLSFSTSSYFCVT